MIILGIILSVKILRTRTAYSRKFILILTPDDPAPIFKENKGDIMTVQLVFRGSVYAEVTHILCDIAHPANHESMSGEGWTVAEFQNTGVRFWVRPVQGTVQPAMPAWNTIIGVECRRITTDCSGGALWAGMGMKMDNMKTLLSNVCQVGDLTRFK